MIIQSKNNNNILVLEIGGRELKVLIDVTNTYVNTHVVRKGIYLSMTSKGNLSIKMLKISNVHFIENYIFIL